MSTKERTMRNVDVVSLPKLNCGAVNNPPRKKMLNTIVKTPTMSIPPDNSFKAKSPLSDLGL
jgi:hypothetical protein